MGIWYRRPLFCLCALFMLSMSAGLFLTAVGRWIVLGVISAVAVTLAVVWMRRRRWGYALLCPLAILVAVLGFARFYHHFEASNGAMWRFDSVLDTECRVQAVVTERRGGGDHITTYAVALRSINGESAQGTAILSCYYVSDLQAGYAVDMTATVTDLAAAASDAYDENAMLADGFCLGLVSFEESDYTVTDRSDDSLAVRLGATRRDLSRRLTAFMRAAGVDKNAAGLPSAMLLGDRSFLTDTVRRDFSRSGLAHMLAISGMHMTLLFGMLASFLRLVDIPRRIRPIPLAFLAGAYLFFLGFPPSATRAVIMLWAVYLSVVCSSRADSLTSLGIAGTGILACFPYAVMDVGFWMSFSATLGLVTLMPLVQQSVSRRRLLRGNGNRPLARLARRVCNLLVGIAVGLLTGVVAMTFSMWITSVAIGEMSLLSPLSTVLLAPAMTVVILLAPLCLLLPGTELATALAHPLAWTCDAMSSTAAYFSQPSWAVVSLRHVAVSVAIILLTALLIAAMMIRLAPRRRWIALVMVAAGWISLFSALVAVDNAESGVYKFSYLQPSSASEALVLVDGREATVVDLSNGSKTAFIDTVREAKARGATEISSLVLTNYTTRTSGSLCLLFGQTMVRALFLPNPQENDDYYLMLSCMEKAELYSVPVYLYEYGADVPAAEAASIRVEATYIERSVRSIRSVEICTAEQSLLYCGAAFAESAHLSAVTEKIGGCDVVIFGNQGPKIKEIYGTDLPVREGTTVVLADAPTAVWLDTDEWMPCIDLRLGPWRGKLEK